MTQKTSQRTPYLIYDINQVYSRVEQRKKRAQSSKRLVLTSITAFTLTLLCSVIYYYSNYSFVDEPSDAFVEHDEFNLSSEQSFVTYKQQNDALRKELDIKFKETTQETTSTDYHSTDHLMDGLNIFIAQLLPKADVVPEVEVPYRLKGTIKTTAETSQQRSITYRIIPGDTLSTIFSKLNISNSDIPKILTLESGQYLSRINTGKLLKLEIDKQGKLAFLEYDIDLKRTISINRISGELEDTITSATTTTELVRVSGNVKGNLSLTAAEYGIPNSVLAKLVGIYQNKINFKRDLRNGDRFALIYEHIKIGDKTYGYGSIMASELNVRGRNYTAIRFEGDNNKVSYLDPQGNPYDSESGFLKHPISNPKITSKFGTRIHPIFKTRKKHNGTDYGARRGTPIMATADGVITHAGRKGSYGKAIVINNGAGIKTLFAHMNSYAKGVKAGKRVNRGDVIGYVGSTGRSTGPHLHYEVIKNGIARNSLTYELPVISQITKADKNKFLASADVWEKELESIQTSDIASSDVVNDIH